MCRGLIFIVAFAAAILSARAEITPGQAIQTCRDQVRQNVVDRFGTANIRFRRATVDGQSGARVRVDGSFVLSRGNRGPEVHQFACGVDRYSGDLSWTQIDAWTSYSSDD